MLVLQVPVNVVIRTRSVNGWRPLAHVPTGYVALVRCPRHKVSCVTFDDDGCLDLADGDATEYLRLNPGFSVMSVEVRRADESTEGWVCGRRPKAPGFETVCQLIEPT